MKKIIEKMFIDFMPKSLEIIKKGYNFSLFQRDCISGLTVSIVSLPLALALAIASGLAPIQGMYTAIIASLVVAIFGGSRFQISGPTGVFAIIILDTIQRFGYDGLLATMLLTGIMLIFLGICKLGNYVRYIPYSVVIGFMAGVGLTLITTQVGDLLGFVNLVLPKGFIARWSIYFSHIFNSNLYALSVGFFSLIIYIFIKKFFPKKPAYLIILIVMTVISFILKLPVETIGSKYGDLPSMLPVPHIYSFNNDLLRTVFPIALTLALLTAIESLLSAKVVDSMSGDIHNPNSELIAEGFANIACMTFSGMPATGTIARTATNFNANAYSPISGVMHSFFLFLFMFFLSPLVRYIPLSSLATILIIVGWNMLDFSKMWVLVKFNTGGRYTLIITILLTVLVDLGVAITIGFIAAALVYLYRLIKEKNVEEENIFASKADHVLSQKLRDKGVIVIRVTAPLFLGVVSRISQFLNSEKMKVKVVILRMGHVSLIDEDGANFIVDFIKKMRKKRVKVIISNVKYQPKKMIRYSCINSKMRYSSILIAKDYDEAISEAKKYIK